LILFFAVLLDDRIVSYKFYYKESLLLFALQFGFTWLFRLLILNKIKNQFLKGKVQINTLIIGAGNKAVQLYKDIRTSRETTGYHFVGFLNPTNGNTKRVKPLLAFLWKHPEPQPHCKRTESGTGDPRN
jgi:polysaccharide biosynthesis protein PslA